MTQDMQTAIGRLQSLPESEQQRIASSINEYLNKLENLRHMIQEGVDSGPATDWDLVVFMDQARVRLSEVRREENGDR